MPASGVPRIRPGKLVQLRARHAGPPLYGAW
jgi:hypothetical protein